MTSLSYIACSTLEEATGALAAPPGGRVLAGGTDLLIELRRTAPRTPQRLVDISRLEEFRGVTVSGEEVSVGALTTHAELAASALCGTTARLLCQAAAGVGSHQIRNRGTVGGNIMNAAACADTVPPLLALQAQLSLASAGGTRTVPIEGFFREPYITNARAGEILTRITFRLPPAGTTGIFLKLGRRNAVAIARLSVAALVSRDAHGAITSAAVVPGAAFSTWRTVGECSELLHGKRPDAELFAAAGAAAAGAMVRETGRRWSTEYKEPVLAAIVRRSLEYCCRGQ